ncbi:hypothetical protein BDK51DRAFT_43164 [Blyttiomyces helicus]|uniref:Uncharacterized protein n=1 Tax=Blyttiomyces helicus TaxID=388810 RepID=A0A4P9WRN0_9FUNG|nr:hypothetical protein BDK51DRAFT_43164 [Blyttiomyces helicus]|eukprot:RKO94548.1 hypothetical protein BDK51DRAFT_43164 [Blyttiomyces helicus]
MLARSSRNSSMDRSRPQSSPEPILMAQSAIHLVLGSCPKIRTSVVFHVPVLSETVGDAPARGHRGATGSRAPTAKSRDKQQIPPPNIHPDKQIPPLSRDRGVPGLLKLGRRGNAQLAVGHLPKRAVDQTGTSDCQSALDPLHSKLSVQHFMNRGETVFESIPTIPRLQNHTLRSGHSQPDTFSGSIGLTLHPPDLVVSLSSCLSPSSEAPRLREDSSPQFKPPMGVNNLLQIPSLRTAKGH